MIKVFSLNKNNKIELTKEQLESLLNEAYYEGMGCSNTYTYTTPNHYIINTPYKGSNDYITITTSGGSISNEI